ncbi:MAG: class I SAM-dependent methyltransferase [Bacilli bacterium]|nr:class I SAM-dependent methyltransferase [Bacilli bacterium]
MEKIKDLLKKYPQAKVLDVGTGVGNFISLLLNITNDFKEIIGIDTSKRMLNRAQTNFTKFVFVRFEIADANKLPYDDATFDIVCLSNSLHHLNNIISIFTEMRRVLRPNGIIIINEMVKDGLSKAQISHMMLHHFSAEIDRRLQMTHNETYTKQEIIEILSKINNLAINDHWKICFPEDGDQPSPEDIENLFRLIDRIISPTQEFTDKEYFTNKAEVIKNYIRENSYDSAPQFIFVLQHI